MTIATYTTCHRQLANSFIQTQYQVRSTLFIIALYTCTHCLSLRCTPVHIVYHCAVHLYTLFIIALYTCTHCLSLRCTPVHIVYHCVVHLYTLFIIALYTCTHCLSLRCTPVHIVYHCAVHLYTLFIIALHTCTHCSLHGLLCPRQHSHLTFFKHHTLLSYSIAGLTQLKQTNTTSIRENHFPYSNIATFCKPSLSKSRTSMSKKIKMVPKNCQATCNHDTYIHVKKD